MSNVLDRVPVDRITAEARQVDLGRSLLTLVAAILFAVGWLAARAVGVLVAVLSWCLAAVKVGWAEARRPAVAEAGDSG